MIIYFARHGQTALNKGHLMQGRTDEPLNETGLRQIRAMRERLLEDDKDLHFDAVYASPLQRAITTGAIIGGVPESEVITDERIIEADFGRYELRPYHLLGPMMTLYWRFPEIFPTPRTVETVKSMISRSHSFLRDLEKKDYGTVLVACHGGILRPMFGYMEGRKNGIVWRPKPKNCEVRVYESTDGRHTFLRRYSAEELNLL